MAFLLFVYALECVVVDDGAWHLIGVLYPRKPSLGHPGKFVELTGCCQLFWGRSHE